MQKSRIYLLLAINTIVFGLVVLVMPRELIDGRFHIVLLFTIYFAPIVVVYLLFGKIDENNRKNAHALESFENELTEAKEKLTQVSTVDELTGSGNKRRFHDVLAQQKALSERGTYRFTIAITQIDQFSEIIENQGLETGNDVLQLFSRVVNAALREVDTIARLEADKFGLILSGCSEEDALPTLNRISQLIGQIQVHDQGDLKITASSGITSYHGSESVEDLVEHAEQALSFAVEQGRDRIAGYNYTAPSGEMV